jgi:hypothetical protein
MQVWRDDTRKQRGSEYFRKQFDLLAGNCEGEPSGTAVSPLVVLEQEE